ncbi:MAG: hypothetical protein OIN89_07850 [Candidatus Methanoperedens sp.]|jgi:hypothetical protein|nr:hypothetical protein [Candidatus Methanoperedens sp.]
MPIPEAPKLYARTGMNITDRITSSNFKKLERVQSHWVFDEKIRILTLATSIFDTYVID